MSRINRPIAKVTSSVRESMRIGWATFRSVIFFLIAAAFVLGVVSPALDQVFSDQPKAGTTASRTTSKATLNEVGFMAESRAIHERTAYLRSQLNTPLSDKFDPLSNPQVIRRLRTYEQAVTWNGSFSPKLIALVLVCVLFVVAIPIFLLFSGRASFWRTLSFQAIALMALVVLTQPLANMTLVRDSVAIVVDNGFMGSDSFKSLQAASQQELVDQPAARAALGADGQSPAAVRYVAKLHNGKVPSGAELAQFKTSHSNVVKSMIVAVPTVVSAIVDADIQRPLIWLAASLKTVIKIITNPVTNFGFLLLIASGRRFVRRYLVWILKLTLGCYAALFSAVSIVTLFARFSVLIARAMNNADIGMLATTGSGLVSLLTYVLVFWLLRKGVVKLYRRIPSVKASLDAAATSSESECDDSPQRVKPARKHFKIGLPSRT